MAQIPQSRDISDQIRSKYERRDNTLIQKVKSQKEDTIDVEIGDSKQEDFKPQVKIMRWDNEVNFSARLIETDSEEAVVETDGNKVLYKKSKHEVHFYDYEPGLQYEDGGHEFEVLLKEKPTNNVLQFSIQTKGLRFYKQEEEQIKRPDIEADIASYDIAQYLANKKPSEVIDLGGSTGWLIKELEDLGVQGICIDNSDIAYDNRETQNYLKLDIFSNWNKIKKTDLITGVGILECIPDELVDEFISQVIKHADRAVFFFSKWEPFPIKDPQYYFRSKEFWFEKFSGFDIEILESQYGYDNFVPPRVRGSYAVYHEEKRDNIIGRKNYKTGKAFHIYRPRIISDNGLWTWGEIQIDEEQGIMSIIIPDDFLNNAQYPILVDPTFGYTSIGATLLEQSSLNDFYVAQYTSAADIDTADSFFAYRNNLKGGSPSVKGVIYVKNGLNWDLVSVGDAVAWGSLGWIESVFSSPPTLTPSIAYALMLASSISAVIYYDADGGVTSGYDTNNDYTNPSSSFVDSTVFNGLNDNRKYSYYINYTAAGGGGGDHIPAPDTTIPYNPQRPRTMTTLNAG